MCTICKKFKKGSIDVKQAKEELDELAEYLSEEHIEEIEEMIFQAEDTYEYMMELKAARDDLEEETYAPEEDLYEEEKWDEEDE